LLNYCKASARDTINLLSLFFLSGIGVQSKLIGYHRAHSCARASPLCSHLAFYPLCSRYVPRREFSWLQQSPDSFLFSYYHSCIAVQKIRDILEELKMASACYFPRLKISLVVHQVDKVDVVKFRFYFKN